MCKDMQHVKTCKCIQFKDMDTKLYNCNYVSLYNIIMHIACFILVYTFKIHSFHFRSEFGQSVAKEYLKCFDFQKQSLDDSLRQFLSCFSLTGESQERERIMVHFSKRYHECNPYLLESSDVVHGITVALLLLNTDLHGDVSALFIDPW